MSDVALGTSFLIFSFLINLPKEYIQLIFFGKSLYTHTHICMSLKKKKNSKERESKKKEFTAVLVDPILIINLLSVAQKMEITISPS